MIDRALSVRSGRAELLHAYIDVEPANYNRGFYSVDIRYYYRITAEAFLGGGRPAEICGLAVFDKRVLLFGSEGSAKIFSSRRGPEEAGPACGRSSLPEAVVEAVVKLHAPLAGLSALMTTTVPAMEETIRQLREKAPWCRAVVGGAVLNRQYAQSIGADRYAADAMETVRYAEELFDEAKNGRLK